MDGNAPAQSTVEPSQHSGGRICYDDFMGGKHGGIGHRINFRRFDRAHYDWGDRHNRGGTVRGRHEHPRRRSCDCCLRGNDYARCPSTGTVSGTVTYPVVTFSGMNNSNGSIAAGNVLTLSGFGTTTAFNGAKYQVVVSANSTTVVVGNIQSGSGTENGTLQYEYPQQLMRSGHYYSNQCFYVYPMPLAAIPPSQRHSATPDACADDQRDLLLFSISRLNSLERAVRYQSGQVLCSGYAVLGMCDSCG